MANNQKQDKQWPPLLEHGGADVKKMAEELGVKIPLESPFTVNDLNKLFPLLRAPIRQDAVEATKGHQTGKGYDTTGYGYQALVDRLNEVVGIGHWDALVTDTTYTEGKYSTGRLKFVYELNIRLEIGYPVIKEDPETGLPKRHWVMVAYKEMVGTHESPVRGDAYKGAYTNGLKKCVGFFGPGADAYLGIIDEDNQPLPPDLQGERVGFTEEQRQRQASSRRSKKQNNNKKNQSGSQGQNMTQKTWDKLVALVKELNLDKSTAAKISWKVTGTGNSKKLTEDKAKALIEKLELMRDGALTWDGNDFKEEADQDPNQQEQDNGPEQEQDDVKPPWEQDPEEPAEDLPNNAEELNVDPEEVEKHAERTEQINKAMEMDWNAMQKLAKDLGINPVGKKKRELAEMIVEATQ